MQSAAIPSVASHAVASFVNLTFDFYFSFSSLDWLSSSVSDSFVEFSTSCLLILLEKIVSIVYATAYPSVITTSVLPCNECVHAGREYNVEHPKCGVWAMDRLEGSGELIDNIDQRAG